MNRLNFLKFNAMIKHWVRLATTTDGKKIDGILNLLKYKTKLYYRGAYKYDLLIYDDFFPNPMTGFRLDEFTFLLERFQNSGVIVASEKNNSYFNVAEGNREEHLGSYIKGKGKNISSSRLRYAGKLNNINSKVVYVVFYFNLLRIYKSLEIFRIPYIFTLYPGGGFVIDNEDVDRELKRLLSNSLCKAVIVNQQYTKNYLLEKGLCDENKIKLIFGLPVASEKLNAGILHKKYYPHQKEQLDICFVGNKYVPLGRDKGYDIFIECAVLLSKQFDQVRFHVIGNFNENDIDVSSLNNRIRFYGSLEAEELNKYLLRFDMIISPNRPFVLAKGAFDGFPLGTCVEASLAGCCLVMWDPLESTCRHASLSIL